MSVKKITGQLICMEDAHIIANDEFGAMGPHEAFIAGKRHFEFHDKFARDNMGYFNISFSVDPDTSKQGNEACFVCGDEAWGERFLLEAFGTPRDNPFDAHGYLNAVTDASGWRVFGAIANESKVALHIIDGEVRRTLDLTSEQAIALGRAIEFSRQFMGSPVIEQA